MKLKDIIEQMKQKGIWFENGLAREELDRIEARYGIVFPPSLREFYGIALPISAGFPRWSDESEANVADIRQRIAAPYQWLTCDIESGFRLPSWEGGAADILRGAPTLIPVFGHRYMPAINSPDPPVLSTVGRDTVWYGADLCDYLEIEFLEKTWHRVIPGQHVPLWNDLAL